MGKNGMIHCSTKINIDPQKVTNRLQTDVEDALHIVGEIALADSNTYAKHDQGQLIQSGHCDVRNSGKVELVWDTPYARRQYFEIKTASKDQNPSARWRWAHYAQKKHGKDWLSAFKKRLGVKD